MAVTYKINKRKFNIFNNNECVPSYIGKQAPKVEIVGVDEKHNVEVNNKTLV